MNAGFEFDPDTGMDYQARLLKLKVGIDQLEKVLARPLRLAKAEEDLDFMRRIISRHGTPEEKKKAAALELEARNLMEQDDYSLLERRIEECLDFTFQVWTRHPDYREAVVSYLERKQDEMIDAESAEFLLGRAKRTLEPQDYASVKTITGQLWPLLSQENENQVMKAFGSNVARSD